MSSKEIVICTIISKNYLAHARTLADSFHKNNPGGKMFVLLVDDININFDPKKEKFTLININEIGIQNLDSFCFKYSIIEQNTGAKAHFLEYLFEKFGFKKLIYLDPDILITNSLDNLWLLLDRKSILLTPHITDHIHDDKKPSELDLRKAGIFNLGCIALAYNSNTKKFLDWWKKKLYNFCWMDPENGYHVDQKWVDQVPELFKDVFVIEHLGYNVAYWNLMQRKIEIIQNKIYVNKKPLYFFHFSGFVPEDIECVSKHQNRFILKNLQTLRPLFELYRDLLVENGYLDIKDWKCKFQYFDNGIKIPEPARKIYKSIIEKGLSFDNPFKTNGENSFLNYLNENVDDRCPIITRLCYQIYQEREDLQRVFPNVLEKDRNRFFDWANKSLKREYSLDDIFLQFEYDVEKEILINSKKAFDSSRLATQMHKVELGINVGGYFKGSFGIAESARRYVAALDAVGIPYVLNNIDSTLHVNKDDTYSNFQKENPFPINLQVVNADQSDVFFNEMSQDYFKNKYNIAVWAWETSHFPEKFLESTKYFDEIWTLSSFVAKSISRVCSIPVITITCPLELDEKLLVQDKGRFGFDDNFLFLFVFDFASIFERKNPIGIINSFKKAFNENDKIALIIKCINSEKFPDEYNNLIKSCNRKNIKIITENMSKQEYYSLLASCDCYVSLHRSEGFGLTIQEAMYAGKPVIATDYGGNTDFMDVTNSFPVKYHIIELKENYGPYKKDDEWAEPDLDHAASLMRYVYENPEISKKIGKEASSFIKTRINYKITGNEIKNRIRCLKLVEDL